MKYIIIDDERHCRGAINILMEKEFPEYKLIGEGINGVEGLNMFESKTPDFIFLDISMPVMDGFEMLSKIEDPTFDIIFTTAYDNYAIQAFKVSAIDYLLKPIDREELKVAVNKVAEKRSNGNFNNPTSNSNHFKLLLENIMTKNQILPNVAIPTVTGYEMVKVDDIYFLESDSNYVNIFYQDNSSLLVTKTLKEMEELLSDHNFLRIHRSHVINLSYLKEYVKGEGGYVILKNGRTLNVSRRKKDNLIKVLKNHQ